jgi:hypothetical protein
MENKMLDELKEPHYAKVPGFVRRTSSDIPRTDMSELVLDHYLRQDVLPPKPVKPSLMSSSVGKIERILLTIPNYATAFESTYKDIFSKLPEYTRFVIATHDGIKQMIEKWAADSGIIARAEIFGIPDHLHFSVWAEDGYVVVKDIASSKTYFIEPFAFPRYGDGLIADFAANATDLENTQAPLYFQGGNVLIGDDFFLIGADYPANTIEYTKTHIRVPEGQEPMAFVKIENYIILLVPSLCHQKKGVLSSSLVNNGPRLSLAEINREHFSHYSI